MPEILVVDDEPDIRNLVRDALEAAGHNVRTAGNGTEARGAVAEKSPDLLVLDVTMPGEDGFSLARHLRGNGQFGIIMLTASGDVVDRVVGLEVGADDYLVKPFEPAELLARINAVLRRRLPTDGRPPLPAGAVRVGRLVFIPGNRRLVNDAGEEVHLTSLEAELLAGFAANPGKVLSRDRLLDLAPARGEESFDRSIDNRVKRLRRKIEVDPEKPQVIKTVRGAGYVFLGEGDGQKWL